jgi:hypothetical protein
MNNASKPINLKPSLKLRMSLPGKSTLMSQFRNDDDNEKARKKELKEKLEEGEVALKKKLDAVKKAAKEEAETLKKAAKEESEAAKKEEKAAKKAANKSTGGLLNNGSFQEAEPIDQKRDSVIVPAATGGEAEEPSGSSEKLSRLSKRASTISINSVNSVNSRLSVSSKSPNRGSAGLVLGLKGNGIIISYLIFSNVCVLEFRRWKGRKSSEGARESNKGRTKE